jgi:hypothetical protein
MFRHRGIAYSAINNNAGKGAAPMNLPGGIGEKPINKAIEQHPAIGEIFARYEIGCVTCGVGICLVKDVVAIHALGAEAEALIEQEITDYLNTLHDSQKGAAA